MRQYLSHFLFHVVSGETEGVLSSVRAWRQVPSASLGHYASLSFVLRRFDLELLQAAVEGGAAHAEQAGGPGAAALVQGDDSQI